MCVCVCARVCVCVCMLCVCVWVGVGGWVGGWVRACVRGWLGVRHGCVCSMRRRQVVRLGAQHGLRLQGCVSYEWLRGRRVELGRARVFGAGRGAHPAPPPNTSRIRASHLNRLTKASRSPLLPSPRGKNRTEKGPPKPHPKPDPRLSVEQADEGLPAGVGDPQVQHIAVLGCLDGPAGSSGCMSWFVSDRPRSPKHNPRPLLSGPSATHAPRRAPAAHLPAFPHQERPPPLWTGCGGLTCRRPHTRSGPPPAPPPSCHSRGLPGRTWSGQDCGLVGGWVGWWVG